MPDDRPARPGHHGHDRGGFVPRRPGFTPRPPVSHEPAHSVRLRDGEREVEVTGSAGFVRQALDDLPALLARLRAETPARATASISLPPPPESNVDRAQLPVNGRSDGDGATRIDEEVLAVLRRSRHPIGIAEIRKRMGDRVSGQQVRRILERAGDQIVASGSRPAAYRLR